MIDVDQKLLAILEAHFFTKPERTRGLNIAWNTIENFTNTSRLRFYFSSIFNRVFFQNHRINFFVLEVRSMPRSAAGQCSRGYRTLLPQQCRVKTIQASTKQIQSNSSTHVCVWPNSRPKQQDWLQPKILGTLPSLMFSKEVGARWN